MAPELFLTLLTQAPALRALARYAPEPLLLVPALLIVAFILFKTLRTPPAARLNLLATPWPALLGLVALSVAIAVVYPQADALKHVGKGSDADDALTLGAAALWHVQNPYALTTYFGNPLSPGPGWLLLAGPLALLGLTPLLLPVAGLLAIWALQRTRHSWAFINVWGLAFLSSLCVWELAVVGNDLPAWGCALLAVCLGLAQPRLSFASTLSLTVLLGCLATARLPFLYLPVLMGFALLATWPRRAVFVATLGLGVALLLHGAFWLMNPAFYPPIHLLARGTALLQGPSLWAALAVLGTTGAAMMYHWRWWPPQVQVALGLGAPLAVLAFAELAQAGSFALWEGATFLIPSLPIGLYAVLKYYPAPSLKS